MAFNTGNSIGSTDARDLSDNAENFDKALGTLDATWTDRLGVTRDSFEGRLAKGSFYRVGTFSAGYTLTNMRQTLEYSGHEYSWAGTFPKVVAAGSTPATSGGVGAGAWVDRTDDRLRSDINIVTKKLSHVAQMKAAIQIGDDGKLVEWISYYNGTGLGGGVGIVVSSGTGTADDGSFFDTISGLQVKALFNDTVTPYHFGARGESNNDTNSINNCFLFAKLNNKKVTYDGKSTVTSRINTFGVEFDFSKAVIVVGSGADTTITDNNGSVFLVSDESTSVTTSFNLGTFTEGQGFTPSLVSSGRCSVMIESTEQAYRRDDGGAISVVNKADILLSSYGYHRATPAIFTITTPVTLTTRPIRENITIKLPVFEITGRPAANQIQALVRSERNNVKFVGGYVNSRDISFTLGVQTLRAFISVYGVVNNTFEDVVGETSALSFCYTIVGYCAYAMNLNRCADLSGWALQDGNFIRDTVVEDCVGSRIGGHAMVYNFTAINHTSTIDGIGVCGKGKLTIKGLKHAYTDSVSSSPVSTRADYGQCWDGDIDIDGTEITVSANATASTVSVLKLWYSYLTSHDYTSDVIVGKNIKITNTKIVSKKASQIVFVPITYNTSYEQTSYMPEVITIDGVSLDGNIRPTYSGCTAHTNTNISQTTTIFNLENLPNTSGLGELYQLITDADKPNVRNKVVRNFNNCTGLNLTFSLPTGWEINCNNSNITVFDGQAAYNDAGKYVIRNCTIPALLFRSNTGDIRAYENDFTSTTTITFGAGLNLCHGNTCKPSVTLSSGGGIVDTAAELWSYYNTSKFK